MFTVVERGSFLVSLRFQRQIAVTQDSWQTVSYFVPTESKNFAVQLTYGPRLGSWMYAVDADRHHGRRRAGIVYTPKHALEQRRGPILTRATLPSARISCHRVFLCLSVRLSQAGVPLKWLNVGSRK